MVEKKGKNNKTESPLLPNKKEITKTTKSLQ